MNGGGRDLVGRIENILPFHAGIKELTEAPGVSVRQLLDENASLFKEKFNFNMPDGGGFKPHQDSQAGQDVYVGFISALVSIGAATLKNGCLNFCAGRHQEGLLLSRKPLVVVDIRCMGFVACSTEPRDMVFFGYYAQYQSEPNMIDGTRRIYYATCNRLSAGEHMAQYYADKHKSFSPDIGRNSDKKYVFHV